MYLQMYGHVAERGRIKRCEQCGALIPKARANQRFCRERRCVRGKCRVDHDYQSGERARRDRNKRRTDTS